MRMPKKSSIVPVVLVGLLGISSVALGEDDDEHPGDTISFGYDADNHFLAINIHPDDVEECAFENGVLESTYTDEDEDGVYEVEFNVAEICSVDGVVVAGPNGQINHGQLMKAVKSLFDMNGHGCVMRHLAKSDLGKGETQIRPSDDDDTWEIGDGGKLEFKTLEADCSSGKYGKGKPGSRGKSATAPGKTKA